MGKFIMDWRLDLNSCPTRRHLLRGSAAAGVLLGLDGLGFLPRLPMVSAAEAALSPSLVRLDSSIEPLVALLEDTPRERLLEEVAARIHKGTTYREVLTALLLAGVRNVQPRPSVGFKFHAVLVVNSAHLASLSSPDTDRWLPIFWALDYFKTAQARTQRESGWRMAAVDEKRVPSAGKAGAALARAMEAWDEEAADAAAAGVARACTMEEAFELFARYGPRDFRDIGHKAIFVANSFRTLAAIGWQHGEPVLRSLAYALLKFEGDENPATANLAPDRPWRRNLERLEKIRPGWSDGKPDGAAVRTLLAALRSCSEDEASAQVIELLNGGVAPQSVWDAVLCGAAELMMRTPNIITLHSVTTANALRHAYATSNDPRTRLMLMLQGASFLPLFRGATGRGRDVAIDAFEPITTKAVGADAVTECFDDAGSDRMTAASKTLSYLSTGGDARRLIDHARRLVFLKGNDSHDYKFSSAVLEDHAHLSPAWRDRYLAASLFLLPSPSEPDNALVQRTRAALTP
ncbi:MAG TPA: hypothetical protein VGR35_13530 [Tepidisphaeraceae bacterium]|nr:hypothetical protein [Tepidisphaeraceae bacterium]